MVAWLKQAKIKIWDWAQKTYFILEIFFDKKHSKPLQAIIHARKVRRQITFPETDVQISAFIKISTMISNTPWDSEISETKKHVKYNFRFRRPYGSPIQNFKQLEFQSTDGLYITGLFLCSSARFPPKPKVVYRTPRTIKTFKKIKKKWGGGGCFFADFYFSKISYYT